MKLRVKEKQENKLNTKKIKIGVLGGSFDPAHKGHLAISKEAKKRFQLQNIIWAITKKNPFKVESEKTVLIRIKECKRIIGLNIWRSVSSRPLERFPLAVCDRTSIDPGDLEYKLNVNAPVPFNAHYCKPNDDQRWYYYPKMSRDEALVFLTYDSHPPYGGLFCPTLHTAVDLPDSEGLQPRQSVEVRIFAELPLPL